MRADAQRLPAPGELVELTVGEPAHGGWCVARPDQRPGPVIFVRHALPGERVRAVITQTTSKLARADAVEILTAAAGRVRPPCPQARPGGCGGCDWQHASLPAQRELKAAVISGQLRRIAGIDRPVTVEPVPGDENGLGWRTSVRFAVRADGVAGLRAHRSHEVIDTGGCPIAHPLIGAAQVTSQRWPGPGSVQVRVAPESGDRTVLAAGRAEGPRHLRQRAAGRQWRVSAASFWQVHPGAASLLAAAVLDALAPRPGDRVLDLYCGAGLFAGVLGSAVGPAGQVTGLERDRAAVRDARRNLRAMPWARVRQGDAAALLARHGLAGASLAVLDPPRTGAARPVVSALCGPPGPGGQGLRRIAYVSCDPATLARDLALLAEGGWQLHALRAFDAFPMTHHVECLAVLTRPGRAAAG
ncbi:MAG TPA: methyltransferase domain-containing protein [Streptosporangiaceae bacterium]|jgi:tRNA/tmRNA/rRNA uracil-C5-methylase (TrmA/RlmC/RlmD family)